MTERKTKNEARTASAKRAEARSTTESATMSTRAGVIAKKNAIIETKTGSVIVMLKRKGTVLDTRIMSETAGVALSASVVIVTVQCLEERSTSSTTKGRRREKEMIEVYLIALKRFVPIRVPF